MFIYALITVALLSSAELEGEVSYHQTLAQWQAEALEALGNHFMVGDSHKAFILQKADELRRQAEE